ncbi:Stk1 family PASTA domain-containing Ser/Thr kinase [Frankia sp. AgB1.8]|uniref:Stk1 family PASTA domain-containing Ser/Thr kinase n=1 Tax=Frankia sp. AgB1.8 TaxID=2792839 RepID=UPI001933F082|nr:Stk1 family PASTA domain-containing Ser/Thr kinase [Frankia sp. AgB1.8]MBL7621612.1 Stk1 family PASTA domain-containing Ser/Thr kinase [Frankia sp. AgB1.8]
MDATVADPVIGRLLDGRYTAQERLAVGGMATVYIAHDNRLDRMVALKVMHPNLMHEPDFVARFHREARAVAALNSPRVVSVLDQGSAQTPAGVLNYLVMELVRGRSLRQYLASRGRLMPFEALDIIDAVAEALTAAHQAGIIHRDIKPENILLGDDGQVKVADFGLARPLAQPTEALTQGVVMGTVGYLAPEQVTHGIADYRSDVYAAGVVLFEMLTGQLPHTGATPMSVAYQSVHSEIPAPSQIVPGIPPELDSLTLRATARRADQRPQDGPALLDEVRRVAPFVAEPSEPAGTTAYPGPYAAAAPPTPGYAPTRVNRPVAGEPDPFFDTDGYDETGYDAEPGGPGYGAHSRRHSAAGTPGWRRPPGWVFGLAAAVVVLILLIVGAKAILGGGGGNQVPLLTGEAKADAVQELKQAGLKAAFGTAVYSTTIPVDHVVSQSPSGTAQVKSGDTVKIILSLGPQQVAVPDLQGLSQADAQVKLQKAGLSAGGVQTEPNDTIAEGMVVSSDPAAGTKVDPSSQVTLVVSSGKTSMTIPADVIGKSFADAKAELAAMNLQVQRGPDDTSGTADKNTVATVSPGVGSTVNPGDTVTLSVSTVDQSGTPVKVPDVKGKSWSQAQKILRDAGLNPQKDFWSNFSGGNVTATSPNAGKTVASGSTVYVRLGAGYSVWA